MAIANCPRGKQQWRLMSSASNEIPPMDVTATTKDIGRVGMQGEGSATHCDGMWQGLLMRAVNNAFGIALWLLQECPFGSWDFLTTSYVFYVDETGLLIESPPLYLVFIYIDILCL